MPIDALLFDKDGTLFDFAATWNSWSSNLIRALADGQGELAQTLAQVLRFDLAAEVFHPDSFVIAGTNAEVAAALCPHLPAWSAAELAQFLEESAAEAPVVEAVPLAAFLDGLRAQGLVLGVVTNDSEASAFQQLDAVGVRDRFAFVAGYDSGYGAKPNPEPLLAFCAATGVAPGHCAMVGDSTHDLQAGRAAGMKRIAVLTGPAQRRDLMPYADVVLPNIGEIPRWMAQMTENSP